MYPNLDELYNLLNTLILLEIFIDKLETKNVLQDEDDCGVPPDGDPELLWWPRLFNQSIAKEHCRIEETDETCILVGTH